MPSFRDDIRSVAPPEEVWKLLYDPRRMPEWWVGIETVRPESPPTTRGETGYTMYLAGYPDYPMPQRMRTDRVEQRVVVSRQVSDLEFAWSLAPHGDGTHITVDVLIPEREAARLPAQQDCIAQSLRRLAEVAARSV